MIDKEKIEAEAKKLLADFNKTLAKVKLKEKKANGELGGFRKEGAGVKCEIGFRERMFANAPAKEGDFIIAEKKSW